MRFMLVHRIHSWHTNHKEKCTPWICLQKIPTQKTCYKTARRPIYSWFGQKSCPHRCRRYLCNI